jgi:DNA sulfur modification protein DndD
VGFPPRNLSRGDYVLGAARGWSGVRNRHARDEGAADYGVRVELGDVGATLFTADRRWIFTGDKFEERLIVEEAGKPGVKDAAAEERLAHLLPRELAPYFFFDGEEVQFLAEASDDARAQAMERLLSLSFVTGVEEQLRAVVKEWQQEALPHDVQVEIIAAERRRDEAEAQVEALTRREEDLVGEAAQIRERADTLRRRMEGMRAGGVVADTRRLDADIKGLESALESDLMELATELATDAPLLANPGLVKAGLAALNAAVTARSKTANSVVDTLKKRLAERLFDEPRHPQEPLSRAHRDFYEDKLKRILESYEAPDSAPPPLLDSFDLRQAREMQQRFVRHEAALPTLRQDRARRLKDVSSRKAQLTRLRAERREAEVGGGERATAYHSLEQEFAAANRTIGDLESRLEQQRGKIAAKQAEAQKAKAELAELGRRHRLAEKSAGKLRIAVGLRETLEVFRKRSRAARRQEIETAVNRHFRRLMTGHRMIDRIAIDEEFVMRFLDADGVEFGQLTVSHGMRQLAVTALLWALKDVSGRALPIIVDTPLARIDRENQQNLLTQYYPNAAGQVIILATDSEIDEEKFALLRGHVGVQFRLDNPDGQSTRVRRLAFVDRLTEEGEAHG